MPTITKILRTKPGVQRDGTSYSTEHYIDAQHCRFYLGKPRKMGGYRLIYPGTDIRIRTIFPVAQTNNLTHIYMGRYNRLSYVPFTSQLNTGVEVERTPDNLPSNANNVWSIAQLTTGVAGTPQVTADLTSNIIAAAIPNLNDITSTETGNVYIGEAESTAPLTKLNYGDEILPSGGITVVPPFLFLYGNDGKVSRSQASRPDIIESTQAIANTKVVYGAPTGAGGTVPSVLFWSLNSLIRGVFDPAEGEFSYATLASQISILSSNCVVQYGQVYFWIGLDQFYVYNGVVKPLKNDQNLDDFFNNINMTHRNKVWGYVNRKYQEIWWFYPRGDATECTHAVIYNMELNVWYDTALGRCAGAPVQETPYPILSDSQFEYSEANIGKYGLWLHEFEFDKQSYGGRYAIPSYYVHNIFSLSDENPQMNVQFRTRKIEPDFQQVGNITIEVINRGYPQSIPVVSERHVSTPTTERIETGVMGRYVTFRVESNEVFGFYQMGQIKVDFDLGDVRPGS